MVDEITNKTKQIKEEQIDELVKITNREIKKLEVVFKNIEFIDLKKDVFDLLMSYYNDMIYFYKQKDIIKAFELMNYVWGMLDILANLKFIQIKDKFKKWFKAEF